MDAIATLSPIAGRSVAIAATASSVNGTIDCTGCDKIHVANTSATLFVAVRVGTGAQTAVLTTDIVIPPLGQIVLAANAQITNVAAIGSAAGPTTVQFTPLLRGV